MFDRSSIFGLLSVFAVILIFGIYISLLASALCNIRLNWLLEESTEQDGSIIRQQEDLVTALDENEAFVLFREKLRLRKLNISRDAELRRLYLVKPSQNTSQLIDHY